MTRPQASTDGFGEIHARQMEGAMDEHYTYCTCPTCLDEKTIPTAAPGTEPPRERSEAPYAGRMLLWSLACGAVVGALVWWAL